MGNVAILSAVVAELQQLPWARGDAQTRQLICPARGRFQHEVGAQERRNARATIDGSSKVELPQISRERHEVFSMTKVTNGTGAEQVSCLASCIWGPATGGAFAALALQSTMISGREGI
jgi:hypothetical protein